MRILFITHCREFAGANRSMLQLIIELQTKYNIRPFVLIPQGNVNVTNIKEKLVKSSVPFFEYPIIYFKTITPQSRKGYIKYIISLWKLSKKLKPYDFDLIHSNSSVIDIGGYLSLFMGIPHIWHLREYGDIDYNLFPVFGKWYERLTYKNAKAFIAISKSIKEYFKDRIQERKIHVIYNGIPLLDDINLSQHTDKTLHFFCAGIMVEGKNQMEILQAAKIMEDRGVKGYDITFVGIQTPYVDIMKNYILEQGLADRCKILDEIDGISSILKGMDVGIVPSKCEAFGRVTVEYMLQNLAVIANDQGANTEIIEDGKSGLIYKRGDEIALANCMLRLMKDRELLIDLSRNGRERAKKLFLSQYNTKAICELYSKVLNEKM